MSISIQCPRCLKAYVVADEMAGKRLKCRDCGEVIAVSGAASPLSQSPTPHQQPLPSPSYPSESAPRVTGYGNAPPGVPLGGYVPQAVNMPVASYGQLPQPPVSQPPKSGGVPSWLWIGCGGAVLFILLCCGGGYFAINRVFNPKASPEAYQPFPLASVPVPPLPERPELTEMEAGVLQGETVFSEQTLTPTIPGGGARMWLYLPPGDHAPKSLPCVLIAPAGSDMLSGMDLAEGDEAEHTPYVQAGFAVLAYELDGPEGFKSGDEKEAKSTTIAFYKAGGGVVNGRNALEFVLAKVPEVDPNRIFAAGHSSAGTVALLLAEHEPRVKACVAYAPGSEMPEAQGILVAMGRFVIPEIVDLSVQASPRTHEARLNCPLFLFHAQDDSNIECSMSEQFAARLKALGKDVTLVTVPTGDHYDSMIEQGIPQAIEWLKKR